MSACIGSCLGSCVGSALCGCLSGKANPQIARVSFFAIFTISTIISFTLRDHGDNMLKKIPALDECDESDESQACRATQAVLRISFATFIFFITFSLVTIGVESEDDCPASLQQGFWPCKLILWVVLVFLFFLPSVRAIHGYGEFARFGGGLFILIQWIVLIDFTYRWNESWTSDENFDQCKYFLIFVSASFYVLALVLLGLGYHWFAPHADCSLAIFFLTFALINGIIFTAISLLPDTEGSGLLTSGVLFLYIMYLAVSALFSQPESEDCNKSPGDSDSSDNSSWIDIAALVVVFFILLVNIFTTSTEESAFGIDKTVSSSELPYSFSFSNAIFAVASLYIAMILTSWNLRDHVEDWKIDTGRTSMWIKIVSSWIGSLLYIWTLLGPRLFPDRDFR